MAHGLVTDRDFQFGLTEAWHKLTTIIPKITRECFPDVEAQPLYYGQDFAPMSYGSKPYVVPVSLDDGKPIAPPYCPDSYSLFKPREGWDWVHEILAGTNFTVESLGMIWNRSECFISIFLDELNGILDGHKFYFNLSYGFDRMLSPQAELSGTRIVCWNTQNVSRMTGEVLFKSKATKKFHDRRQAATAEIEKAVGMARVFSEQIKRLESTPCDNERAGRIYAGYLTLDTIPAGSETLPDELSTRARNTVDTLKSLFSNGLGNKGQTEADVYNGYTELYTRGNTDSPRYDASKAWVSGEFGGNADKKAAFGNLMLNNECHAAGRQWSLSEVEELGKTML